MHRAIALLRVHQFARRDAGDLIAKRANRTRQHAERTGGNFDGGDVRLGGVEQDRRNPIARATVEQRLVDERSGVSTRVTARSTTPFASFGSCICSQTATRWPIATSLRM